MNTYSLVGVDATRITHAGTINGKKPKLAGMTAEQFAEPIVKGGSAEFKDLVEGGLFAFDKKSLVIEELIGTAIIVDASDDTTASRVTPATLPFKLFPGEWLKFTSGSKVGCVVRLDVQRCL